MNLAADILRRCLVSDLRVSPGYDVQDRLWTPAEDERLLHLRGDSLRTFRTVARLMGKTEAACARRHARILRGQQ